MNTRYRCTACGNLTRFDVTTSRRTRAFHHFTVGGVLSVEDVEVLAESIDEVSCRWCGTGAQVVTITEDEITDEQIAEAGATGSDGTGSPPG